MGTEDGTFDKGQDLIKEDFLLNTPEFCCLRWPERPGRSWPPTVREIPKARAMCISLKSVAWLQRMISRTIGAPFLSVLRGLEPAEYEGKIMDTYRKGRCL
jgi:hypothetical protein